jgi:hypothetical protein
LKTRKVFAARKVARITETTRRPIVTVFIIYVCSFSELFCCDLLYTSLYGCPGAVAAFFRDFSDFIFHPEILFTTAGATCKMERKSLRFHRGKELL